MYTKENDRLQEHMADDRGQNKTYGVWWTHKQEQDTWAIDITDVSQEHKTQGSGNEIVCGFHDSESISKTDMYHETVV